MKQKLELSFAVKSSCIWSVWVTVLFSIVSVERGQAGWISIAGAFIIVLGGYLSLHRKIRWRRALGESSAWGGQDARGLELGKAIEGAGVQHNFNAKAEARFGVVLLVIGTVMAVLGFFL